jgi:hypothetical protein
MTVPAAAQKDREHFNPAKIRGVHEDDPHMLLLVVVLRSIRKPEDRVVWMHARMPRTAAMLGIDANWAGLTVG